MNFYDWMMVKYLGKSTPRGDLANDMKHVGDFPKDGVIYRCKNQL